MNGTIRDIANFILVAWLVILIHTMKPPSNPPPTATPVEASTKGLSLAQLRHGNILRDLKWDPDGKVTLLYRATELAGEAGEVSNVVKKLSREAMGMVGSRDTKAHLAEEIADVVICADLLAMHEGIDLGAAIVSKFNQTSRNVGFSVMLSAEAEGDIANA